MRTRIREWVTVGALALALATMALPTLTFAQLPPFQGPQKASPSQRPAGEETQPAQEVFVPASQGTNAGLRREVFLNIPGATLADLTNHARFPGQPDSVDTLTVFETPSNSGDDYGVRVSGYLVPPSHGAYRFYLSANGQAALFLSLDEHPEHKRQIALEPVGNGSREWTNGVNQASRGTPATNVSGSIQLVAGQAYYIEALMKAGMGGDHLGVAWHMTNIFAPMNGSAPISAPVLALSPPMNSLPTTGEGVPEFAAIEYEMLRYLRTYGIPSGLLAVMKDGRMLLRRGYGWHDKQKTRPIDPNARFRSGSNVKGMTVAATKHLVARGLFQMNTPIFPYLEMQPYNGVLGDARLNQITFLHCMTHQAGWDRGIVIDPIIQTGPYSVAMGLDHPATRAEHLYYILSQPLQFAPGFRYTYSNVGFLALGEAIEKATGRRWFDVVQKNVLRTWGANGIRPARTSEKLVAPDEPYYLDEVLSPNVIGFPTEELERDAYGDIYLEAWDSAGGVMGTTEDLLRYAQAHVVGGNSTNTARWYATYQFMGDRRLLRKGAQSSHGGQVWGARSSLEQRDDGVDWAAFYSFSPVGSEIVPEPVFNAALDRVTTWPGDNATRIELAADSFNVDENEGSITIGVKRTGESAGAVSAAWMTIPGTAQPGAEFTTSSGTVSFGSNEITALITIPILDDAAAETARSFQVVLENPTGGAGLGIAAATVTIEDDDNRQPPAVSIVAPPDGAQIPLGSNVVLTAAPADSDGTIYTVTYHAGPTLIGEENKPPYRFTWRQPAPGTYLVSARAVDNHGLMATSAPVVVTIGAGLGLVAPGTILREFWNRRPGTTLAMLTNYVHFPSRPTGFEYLDLFEMNANRGDYYGTKLSGFVHPPASGRYVFWIAADDVAQLWLSTDENPGNKRLVASLASASTPRNWTAQPSQQSAEIELTAGQRYYVEALHREGINNDHLAVGWRLPDGTLERPMAGTRLSPYVPTGRPFITSVTVPEGDSGTSDAVFTVSLNGTNAQTVTVNYSTSDGTATAGSDYTSTRGSVMFLPGETTKSILVPVRGDVLGEPVETFFMRLTDPVDPNFFSQAQGVITADDLFIAQHPQGGLARAGSNVTLSVTALSSRPISYQWRFNGTDLDGKTESTLSLPNLQLTQDGEYTVALSDGVASAVSEVARLIVVVNPLITVAPVSQSVVAGGRATFSVGFSGNPMPFGVEWRQGSFPQVSNTVSRFLDFYTLTNAQPSQAGTWRVIVRNLASANANQAFTLTVLPDGDGDGLPDAWEIAHGGDATSLAPAGDLDGDGVPNGREYQAGTNPTNALSYLKVESLALANNGAAARLTFFAASNKTYTVESRAAADVGDWSRVADVIAVSSNRVVEILDSSAPGANAQRYYRLATPRVP
jgi:CubicO group peptidase (beta-lactamase class C family)